MSQNGETASLEDYKSLSSEYFLHYLRFIVFPDATNEELLNLLMAAVNTPLRTLIGKLKQLLKNPNIDTMTLFFIKNRKQTGGRETVVSRSPEEQMSQPPEIQMFRPTNKGSVKTALKVKQLPVQSASPVEQIMRIYISVRDPSDSLNILRHMLFYQHADGLRAFIKDYENGTTESRMTTLKDLRGVIEWGAETI